MTHLIVLAMLLLTGCADSNTLPQPTGPLRAMNPGQWSYSGNDVLPTARGESHE
ncbi:MAG TPA: hypothetical protein VK726_00725 [Acetobacteraceae bacterium]|jgi:hypothetical protein|nr:hypothetical protein [Acetobacteraceae bacterium]